MESYTCFLFGVGETFPLLNSILESLQKNYLSYCKNTLPHIDLKVKIPIFLTIDAVLLSWQGLDGRGSLRFRKKTFVTYPTL